MKCLQFSYQMIAIAFLRCLFTEVAVKIVLYGNTNEVVVLRDFLLRYVQYRNLKVYDCDHQTQAVTVINTSLVLCEGEP